MSQVNEKVREVIEELLTDFQSPDSLDRLAMHIIPPDDRPCHKWSWLNRMIVKAKRTEDARGFKQWNDIGRQIKGGSKAIHILLPNFVKKKEKDATTGQETTRDILLGFFRRPVFRVEDTTGKPVEYPIITPPTPPPLLGVAKTWGIDIRYGGYLDGGLGSANGTTGEIRLASHNDEVFFHELVHLASQKALKQKLKGGSDPKQEVIAEFGAAILMRLYGIKGEGNAYDYIKRYAAFVKDQDVIRACMSVLSRTEKTIRLIINTEIGEEDMVAAQ